MEVGPGPNVAELDVAFSLRPQEGGGPFDIAVEFRAGASASGPMSATAPVVVPLYHEHAHLARLASNEDSQYLVLDAPFCDENLGNAAIKDASPGGAIPEGSEQEPPSSGAALEDPSITPPTAEIAEKPKQERPSLAASHLAEASSGSDEKQKLSGEEPGEEVEEIHSDDGGRGTFQELGKLVCLIATC